MTTQEFQTYLNTPSQNLQNYSFYKAKKGDKISVFNKFANQRFECEFIKYEIIELETGLFKKFGPKNFKKAKQIIAVVNYINEHNIKMKWQMLSEGESESIEIIK
jgi:hypothetical protein